MLAAPEPGPERAALAALLAVRRSAVNAATTARRQLRALVITTSSRSVPVSVVTVGIPAGSGKTVRHLLNRSGNRQLSRALHTITCLGFATTTTPAPTPTDGEQSR